MQTIGSILGEAGMSRGGSALCLCFRWSGASPGGWTPSAHRLRRREAAALALGNSYQMVPQQAGCGLWEGTSPSVPGPLKEAQTIGTWTGGRKQSRRDKNTDQLSLYIPRSGERNAKKSPCLSPPLPPSLSVLFSFRTVHSGANKGLRANLAPDRL